MVQLPRDKNFLTNTEEVDGADLVSYRLGYQTCRQGEKYHFLEAVKVVF